MLSSSLNRESSSRHNKMALVALILLFHVFCTALPPDSSNYSRHRVRSPHQQQQPAKHNYQRDYDSYGEYYVDSRGYTVYLYCYDARYLVEDLCRRRRGPPKRPTRPPTNDVSSGSHYHHLSEYPNGVVVIFNPGDLYAPPYPAYPAAAVTSAISVAKRYNRYDGRGNVHVGKGRFYRRGRDVYVECRFPTAAAGAAVFDDVAWYRSKGGLVLLDGYGSYSGRFSVEGLGGDGVTRLLIRDYRAYDDDGLYRCFATRTTAYGGKTETVFMEVEVYAASAGLV